MNTLKIALASSLAIAMAACAPEADTEDTAAMNADETAMTADATTPGTIVEVAQGDGQFSTLVSAVTAANLGETLSGDGPFTVFAPTNAAFEKIDQATRDSLMNDDTEQLGSILKYHVVEGRTDAATLMQAIEDAGEEGYTISTVGGGDLTATMENGSVVLTDAAGGKSTVSATDIEASNGLIHSIDTVLMPQ